MLPKDLKGLGYTGAYGQQYSAESAANLYPGEAVPNIRGHGGVYHAADSPQGRQTMQRGVRDALAAGQEPMKAGSPGLQRMFGGPKLPGPGPSPEVLEMMNVQGMDPLSARPPIGSGSTIKPSVPSALADTLASGSASTELSGRGLMAPGSLLSERGMSQIPTHAAQMAGAEVPTAMAEMAGAETPTLLAAQEPGISSLGRGVRAALGPGASAASDIFDASWRTIARVGAKAASSPVGRALGSVLGSRVGQMALGPWGVAAMEAIPPNMLGDGSLDMSEMPQQMYSGSYDGADAEPDSDTDDSAMTPANWGATDQIRATPLPSPQPGRDLNDLKTLGSVGEPPLHDLGGGAGARQLPPMSRMPELPMGDTSQVRAIPLPGPPDFRKDQMAQALAKALSRGR